MAGAPSATLPPPSARSNRHSRLSQPLSASEPSHRDPFADIQAFCLFIGYSRSGHSLVGALLDAHPEITIANEANALRLVTEQDVSRRLLFETLVENARRQAEHPRGRHGGGGYSYVVPGQWQGRARLERDPSELTRLEGLVRAPVRLLHVTRNPYDIIARRVLRSKDGLTLAAAIDNFARGVRTIDDVLATTGDDRVLTLRHEALVSAPQAELAHTCRFLGVDADHAYLDACASIVFSSPQTARQRLEWAAEDRDAAQQIIDRHAFLAGYSWSSST